MRTKIRLGVGDSVTTAKGFVEAWKRVERGEKGQAERRLDFDSLETLIKTLSSGRWTLLKTLRSKGPLSIRALANELGKDYKNIHTDVKKLELIGLIQRTRDNRVEVPWDTVNASLSLASQSPSESYAEGGGR